jgi:hypothetical protein
VAAPYRAYIRRRSCQRPGVHDEPLWCNSDEVKRFGVLLRLGYCRLPYSLQFAEKRVSVRCDCNIAFGAGQWGPRYVPRPADQGILLDTLEDDHRNTDSRKLEPSDSVTFAKIDRFFHMAANANPMGAAIKEWIYRAGQSNRRE